MLTLQQAYEVKASIIEYLKATFTFRDKAVGIAFSRFIEDPISGMFKGPYVSLKLPFVKADADEEIPLEIKPSFLPFYHQLKSFKRLTTQNNTPKPTILTTGTGSGKTEAFLFPILDYCYKNKDSKGVKVIILYPMNALATDQAKRLAEIIFKDERLKDKVKAGLFIGEGRDNKKSYPDTMSKEHIIENRDAIISSPPDILLTNFKMLDYALMQSRFHNLWQYNFTNPTTFKFLVLDELHTYEGAQGSDVANLIRRFKLKLNMPEGQLCPIGTSATIGSGEESKSLLSEYASSVFGEEFTEDSIIGENRVIIEEFFKDYEQRDFAPDVSVLQKSDLKSNEGFDAYIKNQLEIWNISSSLSQLEVTEELKKYKIIKDIIEICNAGVITVDDLIVKLQRTNKTFASLQRWDSEKQFSPQEALIKSIISLISYCKSGSKDKMFPFLYVQVHLWIRELSGVLKTVSDKPEFRWREDLDIKSGQKGLPAFYCRECGHSGWLAVKQDNRTNFEEDINDIYKKYFGNHKNVFFTAVYNDDNLKIDEYDPTDTLSAYLNPTTLRLSDRPSTGTFRVIGYRTLRNNYNQHICPSCNSKNTLNIVGQRVATLASVTTSQILSSDLDPSTEKYRKILAFTNGVQDAAHQAGYIEARNYRFTFRTALQKVINESGKLLTLQELQEAFREHWSKNADESGESPLEAYFYKFFPSDHAGDIKIKDFKKGKEIFDPKFVAEFDNRIAWEVASEFGYNAVIGRTLEKTGSSGTFFDSKKLDQSYELIQSWLEQNALSAIQKDAFLQFLIIFLHRLRIRGGVDHRYLNKFRTGRSSYYLITQSVNKELFLIRNFGRGTRLPKFITDKPNTFGVFDLTTRSGATNWFHTYFTKAFPLSPNNADLVNEFYSKLLEILSSGEVNLLDSKNAEGEIRNYSIQPDKLSVQAEVTRYECSVCGSRLTIGRENEKLLTGAKCINYRCVGSYTQSSFSQLDNYYRQVYNRGKAPRIYATDHTGLLERKKRELIEQDFKERPRFNSLNALVATSTLEMGIDIGDLNSALNTSIPPLPANYLQRIGRAGRSSGSAIIVNFASNEAHDLYYYEEPLEMMEGEINTPGCFLEAKEILRRHFFAFCIDSWTGSDPGHNVIPSIIRLLNLEIRSMDDPDFFINRIISYAQSNENLLLNRFKSAYKGKVADAVFDELRMSLKNDSFYLQIRKAFSDLKEEIRSLREKQREINEYVKQRQLSEGDPEREELTREYSNINATIYLIRKRQILEHLTNIGLLPNYAFPETGVSLKAQVRRRSSVDPKSYDLTSIEIVRSAKSAIRELVPDNLFYTQGFKLEVSGLNVISWKEEALDYRFCSKCDNLQEDIPPILDRCPKCGDDSWRSTKNRHKFLRMKAVSSFNDEAKSKLDDSSEDRESKFSHITRQFKFNQKSIQGSWVMLKIPFGIEFFKNISVYETNSGLVEAKADRSNTLIINGQEVPAAGYIVCRSCGKASSSILNEKNDPKVERDYHFGYCKNKTKVYHGKSDEVFEEVFLYRKMDTEALRILLPVQEFNTDSSILMFKAGIALGLKKYYRGNPDHLDISQYSEYNQQTQRNDRYIVIYDVIPGGSGYLGKLFHKDEFTKIIKYAFESIRECGCQFINKDGCYKCIFTYGNQFEREELSRKKAEDIFGKIYRATSEWEYLENGLSKVTNSGQIEESELEERFIKILSSITSCLGNDFILNKITEDGITKYLVEIKKKEAEIYYEIRPQVPLGPADGVKYSTRADFLISCLDYKINGKTDEDIVNRFKPIAVYLDGYQYHASENNNIFIADIRKRKSILDSNKYFTWTLTWDDLTRYEEYKKDVYRGILESLGDTLEVLKKHPLCQGKDLELLRSTNNLSRLLWLMLNAQHDGIDLFFRILLLSMQSVFAKYCVTKEDALRFVQSEQDDLSTLQTTKDPNGLLFLDAIPQLPFSKIRIFQSLKNIKTTGRIKIDDSVKSYPKEDWNTFWIGFNIAQFDIQNIEILVASEVPSETISQDNVEDIVGNFDEKYHSLLKEFMKGKVPFYTEGYYSLTDATGRIIAEAIVGLPEKKIVLDVLDEESKIVFESNGYKVYTLQSFDIKRI